VAFLCFKFKLSRCPSCGMACLHIGHCPDDLGGIVVKHFRAQVEMRQVKVWISSLPCPHIPGGSGGMDPFHIFTHGFHTLLHEFHIIPHGFHTFFHEFHTHLPWIPHYSTNMQNPIKVSLCHSLQNRFKNHQAIHLAVHIPDIKSQHHCLINLIIDLLEY